VDEEIRKLTSEALQRARDVLHHYRDKVESLAARLLATEVVEEEDLRKILGPKATSTLPPRTTAPALAPVGDVEAPLPPPRPWGNDA
jgi:cell division protease FtsH